MSKKGFTLVELLITIAIIGLLATLSMVGVRIAQSKAKVAKAQNDIAQIEKAISILANDTNIWPGHQVINSVNDDGINPGNEICSPECTFGLFSAAAGLTATDGSYPGWNGPYIKANLRDAWNNEYFFDTDYGVNSAGSPCVGGGGAGCVNAVAVGSSGPDGIKYNVDDIIKIISK